MGLSGVLTWTLTFPQEFFICPVYVLRPPFCKLLKVLAEVRDFIRVIVSHLAPICGTDLISGRSLMKAEDREWIE